MSSFFSKTSGVVVSISEFDRTELITKDTYPVYNYAGGYIGYVDHGKIILMQDALIDPVFGDYDTE